LEDAKDPDFTINLGFFEAIQGKKGLNAGKNLFHQCWGVCFGGKTGPKKKKAAEVPLGGTPAAW